MREVLIVAGEVSGDLHAAAFARALRARRPDTPLAGIGSVQMAAAGVELIERSERLAAMGFVEVLRSIPHHWQLLRSLRERLASGRVGLLVVLDYPGFNLRLAAIAHALGVPVLYYITPQVWAWGAKRIVELKRVVTRAAVILPFEEALLRDAGIDATFVGHPLLDRLAELPDREEARRGLSLPSDARVLAIFPGSRSQEIARHLEIFVATGRKLEARYPGLRIVVSVAPGMTIDPVRCPWPQVAQRPYEVLRAADAALCKSGTTTLEAALAGCPLVIAYKANPLSSFIALKMLKVKHVGLVNIVAGRTVAGEFIQGAMTADALAAALVPLLASASPERETMLAELRAVRDLLGTPGAAARVAAIADGMLA